MSEQARNAFHRVYNGQRNFMTPNLIRYGKRGKMVFELSSGRGIDDAPIYGVTVIELPSTRRSDLSTLFHSIDEATAYIARDFVRAD